MSVVSERAAQARGWKKEEGRGVFTRTADTQYYVWRDEEGKLTAYQFHNERTGRTSPVVCDANRAKRFIRP